MKLKYFYNIKFNRPPIRTDTLKVMSIILSPSFSPPSLKSTKNEAVHGIYIAMNTQATSICLPVNAKGVRSAIETSFLKNPKSITEEDL